MSITSTRGSRQGTEKPWQPLAVLRPRTRTPGAYASAIQTNTDPLAGKGAVGRDGQTQGGRQGSIAQTGAGLRGSCGDTHEARYITGQAASAEHMGGLHITPCGRTLGTLTLSSGTSSL